MQNFLEFRRAQESTVRRQDTESGGLGDMGMRDSQHLTTCRYTCLLDPLLYPCPALTTYVLSLDSLLPSAMALTVVCTGGTAMFRAPALMSAT